MDDLAYLASPPALSAITAKTAELQFSMGSEPLVGAMLRTLAGSKPKGRFLELGTGTGIGTAWLLSGMDRDSTLISVDIDPATSLPMDNLTFAGGSATPTAYGRYTSAASIGGIPVGCGLGPGSWTDR